MTKKVETLSYISKLSREAVMDEIAKHNDKLAQIRKCLAERGEDIDDARTYQIKGVAWRRKEVMAQCEAWMNSTNCPDYLREDYRQKAYASCDNDYIAKINSAMFGLKLNLTNDVEVAENGEWRVKQSVIDAKLEACRYTLTPEEVEAYHLYLKLLDVAEELHKRRYFICDSMGSENDNLYRIEDEETQLQVFLSYYVMTPEERKQRLKELGY